MPDIDDLHQGYQRRLRIRWFSAIAGSSLTLLFFAALMGMSSADRSVISKAHAAPAPPMSGERPTATFLSLIGKMKDTLYTTADCWLEINLDSQRVWRHLPDGSSKSYKVSTGNPYLHKGIETRQGVFMVQTKIDWLYSLQFDSTKVFNWLGFNWGVGFHSLLGWSYYRYLGKRWSSHGCVRVGRDDAKELYRLVKLGTPVVVHKGNPARVIAFLRDTTLAAPTANYSPAEIHGMYGNRLADLYNGNRLFRNYPLIPLDRKIIGHDGIAVGDEARVPDRQKVPPLAHSFYTCAQFSTRVPEPRLTRYVAEMKEPNGKKVEQVVLP